VECKDIKIILRAEVLLLQELDAQVGFACVKHGTGTSRGAWDRSKGFFR